jgi:[ribosomal protein S18]-alanine N-acetyltransferase
VIRQRATIEELEIVPMRRRDLRHVMEIERAVFPDPWTPTVFNSELALRSGRAYRLVKAGKRMVGYIGLMFTPDEAHVTTLAVAPAFQRRGAATLMLLDGVRFSVAEGAHHISLEVASGNERAQTLYRRFGFAPVGVRKGYYPVTGEDAIVMWAYDIDRERYAERLADIEARLRARR